MAMRSKKNARTAIFAAVTLAFMIAAPGGAAIADEVITASDSTYYNQTITAPVSGTIDFASQLSGPLSSFEPISGTLTFTFNNAAQDQYSSSSSNSGYNYYNTYYTYQPNSSVFASTTPGSTSASELVGNYYYYQQYNNYYQTNYYSCGFGSCSYTDYYYNTYVSYGYQGSDTLTINLSAQDLANIESTGSLGYSLSGSGAPELLADSLKLDFAVAPEIDPASMASGLTLLLGCLAVMLGRRSQGVRL